MVVPHTLARNWVIIFMGNLVQGEPNLVIIFMGKPPLSGYQQLWTTPLRSLRIEESAAYLIVGSQFC